MPILFDEVVPCTPMTPLEAFLIPALHKAHQELAAERERCAKLAEECGAFGISSRIRRGAAVIDADGTVGRIDRAAVLGERERCARIAEEFLSSCWDACDAAEVIVASIRSGT